MSSAQVYLQIQPISIITKILLYLAATDHLNKLEVSSVVHCHNYTQIIVTQLKSCEEVNQSLFL